jgi:UDP:flavonoid glycosyltransferase YjiC (YdhE family)
MRFTLLTTGSSGDVRPFVALGQRLKSSGYQVQLAGPENARNLTKEAGLDFFAIDRNTQARLQTESLHFRMDAGSSVSPQALRFAFHRLQSRRQIALQVNRAAFQACQNTNVIIYRAGGYLAGDSMAEKLKIPYFRVGLVPLTQTRAFPSLHFSPIMELGPIGNWLSYPLAERLVWIFMQQTINEFRQRYLNLPALPKLGDGKSEYNRHLPILYAFSPALLPRPKDWPENAIITGYWSLNINWKWQPPASLCTFLADGTAPVYVGFGSMIQQHARSTFQIICQALEMAEVRGVVSSGWNNLINQTAKQSSSDPNFDPKRIFLVKEVPHEWLFSQCSAAVHHGGVGTTLLSLKAGLPTLIVPFNYDQPFWGRRVAKLGAGPIPIPHKKLSVEQLTKALQTCTRDEKIRQVVKLTAEMLGEEDGTGQAVETILKWL